MQKEELTRKDYKENFHISSLESSATTDRMETPPTQDVWNTNHVDVSNIQADRKLISFTFDDAPSKTLENILAVFAAFNESNPSWQATATIFLNSSLFDEQTPHLLHAACALGFELGNHTHRHLDLTTLTEEELHREIDTTDELLQKIDGLPHHLLRTPFGRTNALIKNVTYTPIINWTIDTLDWTGKTADEIYDSVFNSRFSGAIVLMHDGYKHTVCALKRLLPDLMADGYQVVSVSQMSQIHHCKMKKGGTYIRLRAQK